MDKSELWYILAIIGIAICVNIGNSISKRRKQKKHIPDEVRFSVQRKLQYLPRKWTTEGWYWDEDKQKWIPPRFPI